MSTITGSNPLSAYVPGTKAWFTDKDEGWVSATLVKPVSTSAKGEVILSFTMDESGAPRQVTTTLDRIASQKSSLGEEALPPLRNPPLLEATDDLTNLSYLNEPAGALSECAHRYLNVLY
jgi:myosin-5